MKTETASRHLDVPIPVETRIEDLNSVLDETINHAIEGIM
jgi:N-glycosylase/DNA lyase